MKLFNSAKEIGDDTILRRNPDILFNEVDGEVVMLSIENGEYFGLDKVGSRIWYLLKEPMRFNRLIEVLLNDYEVSKEQCRLDTKNYLRNLLSKHLIVFNSQ